MGALHVTMKTEMKTEMKMLDNGNYELVISPIQHYCRSDDFMSQCVEYSRDIGKLHLKIEMGDGYSGDDIIKFCPFCGYSPKTLCTSEEPSGCKI